MSDAPEMIGIWYCEKTYKCTWQGYALHRGLAWGIIETSTPEWRKAHEKHCGGKLVQIPSVKDILQPIRDVTRKWKSKERLYRSDDDDFMDDMENAIKETLDKYDNIK